HTCATQVLQLDPEEGRARAIQAVASFVSSPEESAATVADAIARDGASATVMPIAAPLAQMLEQTAPSHAARVLDAVVAHGVDAARVAQMPALLLAQICERLAAQGDEASAKTRL